MAADWTAYDEGYLQAYQWAAALAGGAPAASGRSRRPSSARARSRTRISPR